MSDPPLGEHAFIVMTALAATPLHGYAILEELRGNQVKLHTGSLYAILDRLRTAGLIEIDREELVQSRLRRYYRLTDAGTGRLATESARLRALADAADRTLRRAARRAVLDGGMA